MSFIPRRPRHAMPDVFLHQVPDVSPSTYDTRARAHTGCIHVENGTKRESSASQSGQCQITPLVTTEDGAES